MGFNTGCNCRFKKEEDFAFLGVQSHRERLASGWRAEDPWIAANAGECTTLVQRTFA